MTVQTLRAPARTGQSQRNWVVLAVLLVGQFMCSADVMIVNVAMPSIGRQLHASGASLQLIVGGYTIAYAMLLITGARLGDRYGRRRMFQTGVTAFTAASLACALAPDSQALIGFRFLQGAGAALLVPQIFSIIQLRFSGPARARALSAYAAVLSGGSVAGLVLGGAIVTANLFGEGWRPVFGINVPFGIALAILAPHMLPADEPRADKPNADLDLAGLATAVAAVLLIVMPLVLGQEAGWPVWTFVSMAAGAATGVLFVRIERRVAARGGSPLLNLDVLHAPALPSGLSALAASQVAYGGLMFTFTLFLQAGLGQSALRAGLIYLPMAVTFGLASFSWRRLRAGLHRLLPPVGLALSGIGYLAIAIAVPHGHGLAPGALAGTVAVGAGMGLAISPLLTQLLARVLPQRAADASGLLTTTVQLGQLTGVAILGSVYFALGQPAAHAMSGTAYWLAALSLTSLLAATAAARAAR